MANTRTESDGKGDATHPVEAIPKDAWGPLLDRLSRLLEGKRAEVEVASLGLGEQFESDWAPLIGVSYDHKDDVFSVHVGDVDHLIYRPRSLAVRRQGPAVESLAITDGEGSLHLVRFGEPQMLPPP